MDKTITLLSSDNPPVSFAVSAYARAFDFEAVACDNGYCTQAAVYRHWQCSLRHALQDYNPSRPFLYVFAGLQYSPDFERLDHIDICSNHRERLNLSGRLLDDEFLMAPFPKL